MFIRIELKGSNHEWGCESQWAPNFGDVMWLYYEEPDKDPDGGNFIEATVMRRQFLVGEPSEVWITVTSPDNVPDGMVSDSPAWPSIEWSKRKRECKERCRRIREGGKK